MYTKKSGYVIYVLMFFGLCYTQVFAQSSLEKHESLASKLVNQCANIQEDDFVSISGSVRDADLLDEVAVQTCKMGAYPLVTLESLQRSRRYFDVVPAKYDTIKPELEMKLLNMMNVIISIDIGESLGLFKDVPSERIAAVSEASRELMEIIEKRNIRYVELGNGLYPTDALAKQYGMTKEQLAEQFWNGVNVDYEELEKVGNAMKNALESGKTLRLSSQNGTALSMKIESRPVFVSDGIISDEEMEQGAPACNVWLPAGEVYLTPVPGSVEGTIVVDRFFFQGKEIEKLILKFKAGKLISMSAKSDLESYKERYDALGEGKDEFSAIDIGINPNVQIVPGSKMVAWMASGMVTVGHGNNAWAGGENNSPYGFAYHLTDATIKIDGKVILEKGILK